MLSIIQNHCAEPNYYTRYLESIFSQNNIKRWPASRRSALFPYMSCQCRLLYCRLRPLSSNVRFSSFCTYTTVPSSTQNCASTITSASVPRVSSPAFTNGSCTSTDSASEIHPVFHHTLPQHACANAQVSVFFIESAVRNPTQREILLGGHVFIIYPPKSITAGMIRFTMKISIYSSICASSYASIFTAFSFTSCIFCRISVLRFGSNSLMKLTGLSNGGFMRSVFSM